MTTYTHYTGHGALDVWPYGYETVDPSDYVHQAGDGRWYLCYYDSRANQWQGPLRSGQGGMHTAFAGSVDGLVGMGLWSYASRSAAVKRAVEVFGWEIEGPLTSAEAAAALGIDPATVRQAIGDGRLAATRFGRDWQIDPAEVARYGRERKPAPRR